MCLYKRILYVSVFFLISTFTGYGKTNSFEGHISFVKKTHFDTMYINYFVKGEKIRINQVTSEGILQQSLLVDLEKDKVIAVDDKKKMYKVLALREESPCQKNNHLVIKKTENFREVNGVKCYQWRVRDRSSNSEIAYWVTQNNLDFMNELFGLLSRTDRIYDFFSQIPGQAGYFPVLSVERTLLRKERQRILVEKIDRKNVSQVLLNIPSNYTEISR